MSRSPTWTSATSPPTCCSDPSAARARPLASGVGGFRPSSTRKPSLWVPEGAHAAVHTPVLLLGPQRAVQRLPRGICTAMTAVLPLVEGRGLSASEGIYWIPSTQATVFPSRTTGVGVAFHHPHRCLDVVQNHTLQRGVIPGHGVQPPKGARPMSTLRRAPRLGYA